MNLFKTILLAAIGLALWLNVAEAEEKSEFQKKLLAKYDANEDGRLSLAEREKIRYD